MCSSIGIKLNNLIFISIKSFTRLVSASRILAVVLIFNKLFHHHRGNKSKCSLANISRRFLNLKVGQVLTF